MISHMENEPLKTTQSLCEACGQAVGWFQMPETYVLARVGPGNSVDLTSGPKEALGLRALRCEGCGHLRLYDSAMF